MGREAKILRHWQKRLRITDWHIELRVKRWHEMSGDLGACHVSPELRHAVIDVLAPGDTPDGYLMDIEHTIVHELLHVVLDPVAPDGDDTRGVLFEQAINTIASALLASECTTK